MGNTLSLKSFLVVLVFAFIFPPMSAQAFDSQNLASGSDSAAQEVQDKKVQDKKAKKKRKGKVKRKGKRKGKGKGKMTPKARRRARAKARAEAKAAAKAEAKAEAEAEAKAKEEAEAEAQAKVEAEALAKIKAEAEARAKAEAEAEAEAKAKEEADTKAKAEADAKVKADTEAKPKADAKAKQEVAADPKPAEKKVEKVAPPPAAPVPEATPEPTADKKPEVKENAEELHKEAATTDKALVEPTPEPTSEPDAEVSPELTPAKPTPEVATEAAPEVKSETPGEAAPENAAESLENPDSKLKTSSSAIKTSETPVEPGTSASDPAAGGENPVLVPGAEGVPASAAVDVAADPAAKAGATSDQAAGSKTGEVAATTGPDGKALAAACVKTAEGKDCKAIGPDGKKSDAPCVKTAEGKDCTLTVPDDSKKIAAAACVKTAEGKDCKAIGPDGKKSDAPCVKTAEGKDCKVPLTKADKARAALDADRKKMKVFYKGELGSPGAPELENTNNSFFMGVGYWNIGGFFGEHFMRLTPSVDLHLKVLEDKNLTLRFELPLDFLVATGKDIKVNKGSLGDFRKEGYDEKGEYLKFIKRIQLGRKEERLYLNIGRVYGASLGHGTVMRRYNANIDPDRARIGMQFDAYNDYGGFETTISDIAFQTQVIGALVFAKPLSAFSLNPIARSFSVGAHYTTDLDAPKSLQLDPAGTGRVAVDEAGYPLYDSTSVGIMGFDFEVKPVRLGNALDLKLYGDYSSITDAGAGITAGLLMRSNFGELPDLMATRVRIEARNYDNNYKPEYFGSLYEVRKFQMIRGEPTGTEKTQYEEVVLAAKGDKHTSVYGEATFALVNKLVAGVGVERIFDATPSHNILVHVEMPALEFLRLYASYQKLGFENLGDAFAFSADGKTLQADSVLNAQARIMILPILFVNVVAQQSFMWDELLNGGSYRPQLDFLVEAELGWEFD